jgi:hypothetical protein
MVKISDGITPSPTPTSSTSPSPTPTGTPTPSPTPTGTPSPEPSSTPSPTPSPTKGLIVLEVLADPPSVEFGQTTSLKVRVDAYPETWQPKPIVRVVKFEIRNKQPGGYALALDGFPPTQIASPITISKAEDWPYFDTEFKDGTEGELYAEVETTDVATGAIFTAKGTGEIHFGGAYPKLKLDVTIKPVKIGGEELKGYPSAGLVYYPVCGEKLKFAGTISASQNTWSAKEVSYHITIMKDNTIIKSFPEKNSPTISEEWDGNNGGQPVPEGNYQIYITAKGKTSDTNENVEGKLKNGELDYCPCNVQGFKINISKEYYKGGVYSSEKMNNDARYPIGTSGCELCCCSMILSHHNIKLFPGNLEPNPKNLNIWLTATDGHGGYLLDGAGVLKIDPYFVFTLNKLQYIIENPEDECNNIEGDLRKNYPATIIFNSPNYHHAILAYGKCRDFVKNFHNYLNFKIIDPDATHSTLEQYVEPNFAFERIYRVRPTPSASDASEIYIDAVSFADLTPNPQDTSYDVMEYCITDPLNRKTGYIISSQKTADIQNVIKEIPDSQYLNQGSFKTFRLLSPLSGDYKLQVVGIRDGGYKMAFTLVGAGTSLDHKLFRGISRIISPGTIHNYQITYDRDDVSKSQLIKIVSPQEIKDSLNIASKFHWIDNNGILNSLAKKIENAESAIDRGQIDSAINILGAFINEVQAQKGKHIKNEAADTLIDDAQSYIAQLKGKK